MKKNWNDLDDNERERVAAKLVTAMYFPPQLSDSTKKDVKKTDKKNKKRRRLAVRTLLAHEFGARLDAIISTITSGDPSIESLKAAFLSWAKLWRLGWMNQ